MPMPSGKTKYILSQTKSNLSVTKFICLRQNILSMAKKFISATYKSKKITLPDETVNFCTKEVIFRDLCIAEMNFIAMDKIFCLRQKKMSGTNLILSGQMHSELDHGHGLGNSIHLEIAQIYCILYVLRCSINKKA